ncbi:hypothetical protein CsatB_029161 [Cannabis sativa]
MDSNGIPGGLTVRRRWDANAALVAIGWVERTNSSSSAKSAVSARRRQMVELEKKIMQFAKDLGSEDMRMPMERQ